MKSKLFFLLLFSSLAVLNSCNEIPDDENPLSLADFLNNNKPALQTFTIQAGTASSVTGAKGAVISFAANSFYTLAGDPITSGNVEIQLREVTNKKDMVLCQTPTISEWDELIVSQGVYYLKALQNGFELQISNFQISRAWPSYPINENPAAFLGGIKSGDDSFTWFSSVNSGPGPFSIGDVTDTITNPSTGEGYYELSIGSTFFSQNYNWINCDYFYSDSVPKVALFFPTGDSINVYLFQSYLVFNDLNAVLSYTTYNNSTLEYYNIPTGLNATLVTYYIADGIVFVATADIVTSDALSTPVTFSETTEQGLLDILEAL